ARRRSAARRALRGPCGEGARGRGRARPSPGRRHHRGADRRGLLASLQREEGYAAQISLAYLPPEQAVRPLLLGTPLRLGPRTLAHLSPAVERPGIHIGVWPRGDGLAVWGATRNVPTFAFVLEVIGP